MSSCGAASTLLAFNAANAAFGKQGGSYQVPGEAALDPQLASASLEGREFIFDVQGHYVNPEGAWLQKVPEGAKPLSFAPKAGCRRGNAP